MMRTASLAALLFVSVALSSRTASAHDFSPGVLALAEQAPGTFLVAWTEPVDSRVRETAHVDVVFPEHCRREGALLSCGSRGLHGTITFEGIPDPRARVFVVVERRDGERTEALVTGAAPQLDLDASPESSASAWLALGVEHILGGFDHLLFLLGLLLVARVDRRIVVTITAFTIAHSFTLALAAFDLVRLPSAPVEAMIAASTLLVAREATHDEPTLTRRAPWLVALLFGLVHGLGFAGALREIGVPHGSIAQVVLFFNVGVEVGQLAVVLVVVLAVRALAYSGLWSRVTPLVTIARTRKALCYALGIVASFWLIERVVAMVA